MKLKTIMLLLMIIVCIKHKLRIKVLSGQIKDLYGKIITNTELNKLTEQECENIYKIC